MAAVQAYSGARNVVVTDINEYRLALALRIEPAGVDPTKTDLKALQGEPA